MDAISASESMMDKKVVKFIKNMVIVPPVLPSTSPQRALLGDAVIETLRSRNEEATFVSYFGTKIQPPIAITLNAVMDKNWKFRYASDQLPSISRLRIL